MIAAHSSQDDFVLGSVREFQTTLPVQVGRVFDPSSKPIKCGGCGHAAEPFAMRENGVDWQAYHCDDCGWWA